MGVLGVGGPSCRCPGRPHLPEDAVHQPGGRPLPVGQVPAGWTLPLAADCAWLGRSLTSQLLRDGGDDGVETVARARAGPLLPASAAPHGRVFWGSCEESGGAHRRHPSAPRSLLGAPRPQQRRAGPHPPPNLRLLYLRRQKGPQSNSEQPPRYLGPCSSGASTSGQPRAWATDIEGLCPGAAPLGSELGGQPSPSGPHLLGSQPLGWEGGGHLRPRGTPAPYV